MFLFITKHGTYIDGFAGPQDADNPESWAAKLVLDLEPAWLRDFYLCEMNRESFARLKDMTQTRKDVKGRTIQTQHGDFNVWVPEMLEKSQIGDTTATFALLDQRSCECHWDTVQHLASYKRGTNKIELFYFFPTGWVHRAISGFTDVQPLNDWWGDDGWQEIQKVGQGAAAQIMTDRIRNLGYLDVKAWPIFEAENGGGRTMYHMIHATDHLEAPRLMYRAYKRLISPPLEQHQMSLLEREHLDADYKPEQLP